MPPKTIRFPDDLAEKIQAKADKLDRSFSWVVVNSCHLAIEGEQLALGRAVARGITKGPSSPSPQASKAPSVAETWAR